MLKVTVGTKHTNVRRVLCLGAHCDDIEIGCGGTILRLLEEHQQLEFLWIVFSSTPQRRQEAKRAARMFLKSAQKSQIVIKDFRDGFFPYQGENIKKFFEALKKSFLPDLILTHYRDDLHQDHRLISDLTWNTFRDHLILEYEIPKYDGDLGTPNCYVPLDDAACREKTSHLLDVFATQRERP